MSSTRINSVILGECGNRTPIILLHGWARSLSDLLPLGELLSADYPVHVLDLPGFGDSGMPQESWDTIQYARRILQYLDDNGLAKVNLLGHSFGGRVTLRLARLAPERIEKIILIGSHGLSPKRSFYQALRIWAIRRGAVILKWIDAFFKTTLFKNWFTPRYGSQDYLAAGALKGTLVKTVTEDQSAELPKITAPALLIWGTEDLAAPLEMGRRMAHLIPRARLLELPHQGHDPFLDVNAHLCAYHILPFLAEGQDVKEAVGNG
ncbi:MAG: alpha/beta hydrolase [Deltaproteobacteria bacterium]|nr:alpha/beta hydrolase [Deltaproteobacteria bacterium]